MRISTQEELLELLDEVVAASTRGDRTAADADAFWAELLTREGHPLATMLPDENLVDWWSRGLLPALDNARVLDVGCGNGRNSRWFAEQGARVCGVDVSVTLLDFVRDQMPENVDLSPLNILRGTLPEGPFDVIYDSGCFHHVAPHRRATYIERVLPLLAPSGAFGIVTLASEMDESASDMQMLASGDTGGGTTFSLTDLAGIFSSLDLMEVRPVRPGVDGTFGVDFLNCALFRAR
ncbi:MAG: class I SAM-dependent methyltransferase [Mycobacteriales bacterium]